MQKKRVSLFTVQPHRWWERLILLFPRLYLCRFSPTGVGNVSSSLLMAIGALVQPHWCGERFFNQFNKVGSHGSAPLVWGTLSFLGGQPAACRFSPTGVGNVTLKVCPAYLTAVQPHWCGERTALCLALSAFIGSAPLVWGTCDWVTSPR